MRRYEVRASVAPPGVRAADWHRVARLEPADVGRWTVADVIGAQKTIRSWYEDLAGSNPRARNGVYWFNEFYIGVTEGVWAELGRLALGEGARGFLGRLDVEFYERYRRALCVGDAPAGWRTLFRDCNRQGRHPLQWALEGIHAHIVGDLAPAVAETLRSTRPAGSFPAPGSAEHRAYTRVNEVLYGVAETMLRRGALDHGVPALAGDLVPGEVARLLDAYIRILRQDAWIQARLLWQLWESQHREACVESLGVYAAWYAREVADALPLRPRVDFETVGGWVDLVLRSRRHAFTAAGRRVDHAIGGVRQILPGRGTPGS